MKNIKIKGLRSLVDTDNVPLLPINILVGNNSSGKSTFLRTFPLLRQSVSKRTRGPILWNGELVDFESFETSLHNDRTLDGDGGGNISFSFGFEFQSDFYRYREDVSKKINLEASIEIREGTTKNSCYTSTYSIRLEGHTVTFSFNEDGTIVGVDSERLSWDLLSANFKYKRVETDSLLPIIKYPDFYGYGESQEKEKINTFIFKQIKDLVKRYSGSQSSAKLDQITTRLTASIRPDSLKLDVLRKIKSTAKWRETVMRWNLRSEEFRFFAGLIDLYTFIEQSFEINGQVMNSFRSVKYIAPLRASTERYYRYQDLNVDEIDHQGGNTAMFLSNLSKKWKKSLKKWTVDNFGFEIKDIEAGSHVAIELEFSDSEAADNITDMGFGFSQVLPVIIQLWSVASGYEIESKRINNRTIIFAIEQPELHLHPRMQASLAVVFSQSIELARENGIDLRLIIETHSQSMISKFGDLICLDKLDEDHLNIAIFDQNRKERKTSISYSNFDKDGVLENWPVGFFEY